MAAAAPRVKRLHRAGRGGTVPPMADKTPREERLAQALRDNLKRRKVQARAAAAEPAPSDRNGERANEPGR